MPRLPHLEPLYAAFDQFQRACWLEDRALLWPQAEVWTIAVLEEMRRRFVEGFIEGRLTFREKFEAQLSGAPREVWALAADSFFLYGLVSRSVRFETKKALVEWTAAHYQQQGGAPLPGAGEDVWQALRPGLALTGQKYNLKHAQLRLLTLAALEVKAQPAEQRPALLASPERMQALLDGILEAIPLKLDRANDLRNALLHLAFPDLYEPLLANREKDAVLQHYSVHLRGQRLADDRDAALRQVRKALQGRFAHLGRPFDFYGDLRGEWRQSTVLEDAARLSAPAAASSAATGVSATVVAASAATGAASATAVAAATGASVSNLREPRADYAADPDLRRVLNALRYSPNVILSGPPGCGKTYLAGLAARALLAAPLAGGAPYLPRPEDYIRWVTFHPSYAYEDFVEGLRPATGEAGQVSYEVRAGVFKELADLARADPGARYVLVVDEINRGSLARALGELVTLLEGDKRGALSMILPYSRQPFSVPPNLYLIGTMNTADRSVVALDAALRRRFAFVEIGPRPDLLAGALVETDEAVVALDALLRGLNAAILQPGEGPERGGFFDPGSLLDRDSLVGHAYFLPVARARPEERLALLEFVWNHQVLPLLLETFAARPERLSALLAPFLEGADPSADPASAARLGGEDLVVALSRLAGAAM